MTIKANVAQESMPNETMTFHIIYYVLGQKNIKSDTLPRDTGYEIMRKRANAMPSSHMAMAVHPLDVKTLLPELCLDMSWNAVADRMRQSM